MSEFYTTAEVAERLRVTQNTVRDWAKAGKLASMQFGRTFRFRVEDIKRFEAQSYRPAAS